MGSFSSSTKRILVWSWACDYFFLFIYSCSEGTQVNLLFGECCKYWAVSVRYWNTALRTTGSRRTANKQVMNPQRPAFAAEQPSQQEDLLDPGHKISRKELLSLQGESSLLTEQAIRANPKNIRAHRALTPQWLCKLQRLFPLRAWINSLPLRSTRGTRGLSPP